MSKTDKKAYKKHTYSGSRKCLSRVRAGLKRFHDETSRAAVWRKKEENETKNETPKRTTSRDDPIITPKIPKIKTYQRRKPTISQETACSTSTSTAEPVVSWPQPDPECGQQSGTLERQVALVPDAVKPQYNDSTSKKPQLRTYQPKKPTISRETACSASTSTAEPVVSWPQPEPECGQQEWTQETQGAPELDGAELLYDCDSSEASDASVDWLAAAVPSSRQPQPCCCCRSTAAAVPSSRQPQLCCCCRSAAGAAPLAAGSGATYMDMLVDCFHITYPERLRASASICTECISTLEEGVRFKRRALHCQNTMITRQSGEDVAKVKDKPDQPGDAVSGVQTISSTPGYCYVIGDRINHLEKIKEGYDLSRNYMETHADLTTIEANYHMETSLFDEETDQTQIWTESELLNPEEENFFQRGCKCGQHCQKKFSRFEIAAFRRECKKYYSAAQCDINHMDIFLTGALACSYDAKSKIAFKFRGVTICKDFFMFVFVLDKYQFNKFLKKFIERARDRWSSHSLTDRTIAVKFLKSYSLQNSLILPGRFSNKHPDLHILPKNKTRVSVYCEYTKACVATKNQYVNQALWNKIWECFCPYVVHKVPSDLCKVCREYVQSLSKFGLLSRGLKTEALQGCLKHLQLVSEETEYYDRVMKQPAIGDNTLHCSVDFLQRLRLPHEPTAGHLNLLDAYEVALFAVACQPPGETVVYVVPECVGGKSSNIILSLLNHFLESKCSSDVQCHCGPLLRADRVLQYAAWRGRASRCRLAFLPPGHDTAPDCLGLLKIALKDRPAQTVQDICEVLASIGVIPVPVANERGYLNIPIFNWLAFFDARNPSPVSNIQSYCHFEADSSNVGAVKCKVGVSSGSVDVQSVFQSGCLAGAPEVLPLPGLTVERHAYLYENIRPHLDESVTDVLCDPLELKTEVKMELEEHEIGLRDSLNCTL